MDGIEILNGALYSGGTELTLIIQNIASGGGIIMTKKKINIGIWDMQGTAVISVAHGLSATEWQTINNVTILIITDSGLNIYNYDGIVNGNTQSLGITYTGQVKGDPSYSTTLAGTLNGVNNNASFLNYTSTNINISSLSFFQSSLFNDTVSNRGFIIFDYIAD